MDNSFKTYTDKLAATLQAKNDAYGDSFTESVDKFGKTVIAVRLSDKFNRICNLIKRGELKENDELEFLGSIQIFTLVQMILICMKILK